MKQSVENQNDQITVIQEN